MCTQHKRLNARLYSTLVSLWVALCCAYTLQAVHLPLLMAYELLIGKSPCDLQAFAGELHSFMTRATPRACHAAHGPNAEQTTMSYTLCQLAETHAVDP